MDLSSAKSLKLGNSSVSVLLRLEESKAQALYVTMYGIGQVSRNSLCHKEVRHGENARNAVMIHTAFLIVLLGRVRVRPQDMR